MKSIVRAWQTKNTITALYRDERDVLRRTTIQEFPVAFFDAAVDPVVFADSRVLDYARDGNYWRVTFTHGHWDQASRSFVDHRETFCRQLMASGIPSYEGDVSLLKRWLIDNDVQIQRPRRVYLDIETDSRATFDVAKAGGARVLCWALVKDDGSSKSAVLKEDSDEAEFQLLEALIHHLEPFDQIVGWNVEGFERPVIEGRIKELGVPTKDIRRWMWLDQLQAYKRYNISSAESGEDKVSFKLDHVAQSLLGEGKHDVDASRAWQYWEDPQTRTTLVKYCLQDTDLLRRIEAKTGYLELHQTVCEACGVQPDSHSLKPTVFVDMFMLRLGATRGIRFKTKFFTDHVETDKYAGAYVMQPTHTGILKNVHVCDFASLYPSVMISWNLSPEVKSADGPCHSPGTGVRTRTDTTGIICGALQTLLDLRAEWNKKRASLPPGTAESKAAERRTNAYKMVANSFYGVVGTPYSRFYDREISESTTLNGQWLIKQTLRAAQTRDWNAEVVYGDTDSLFVMGPTDEQFAAFVKECNDVLYPQLLAEHGCVVNKVSLAYEKAFDLLVFTSAKRYVGRYSHYKGKPRTADSKPEIKGLELKRGDTNRLARKLQADVIALFVAGETDPNAYSQLVQAHRDRLLIHALELGNIVLSKGISRELVEYSDRNPPVHVAIAKRLQEAGHDVSVGTRISYVVTDGSTSPIKAIPSQEYTGVCDRHYIWEQLVWPPSYRLLRAMFPRFDWDYWNHSRPTSKYNPDQLVLWGPSNK